MGYNFFTYKANMPEGFTPAIFSIPHFVFLGITFVVFPLVFFLIKKFVKRDNVDLFLKIFSIIVVVLEIADITWESYYQINSPKGFDFAGELPLYTCSLFIYALLAHAWGKGRVKEYSLSFLTTVSLVCGAIGVVYCNGINNYPMWSLGAFYSLYFHCAMFEIGMFLLISGYKRLEWMDTFKSWVPILILAIFATPVNYQYGAQGADYMQTYSAAGVPLFSNFAELLASYNLRYLFTVFYMLIYLPMALAVIAVAKLIYLINGKIKKKPKGSKNQEVDEGAEQQSEQLAEVERNV